MTPAKFLPQKTEWEQWLREHGDLDEGVVPEVIIKLHNAKKATAVPPEPIIKGAVVPIEDIRRAEESPLLPSSFKWMLTQLVENNNTGVLRNGQTVIDGGLATRLSKFLKDNGFAFRLRRRHGQEDHLQWDRRTYRLVMVVSGTGS